MGEPDAGQLADVSCRQCGCNVEIVRRCYAIPTCYTCLPPPDPLPVAIRLKSCSLHLVGYDKTCFWCEELNYVLFEEEAS